MSPAQWDEVNRLFEELYEQDAATRAKALQNIADTAVRAEVESLLAHAAGAQTALESAVGGVFRAAADAGKAEVLYRGIAGRAFERRFVLADHIVVEGADLQHGLLHVALKRVVPEALKTRRIAINGAPQPTPTAYVQAA